MTRKASKVTKMVKKKPVRKMSSNMATGNPMKSGVGSKVKTAYGDPAGKAVGKVSKGSLAASVGRVSGDGKRGSQAGAKAKTIKSPQTRTRITRQTNGRGRAGGA